MATKCDFYIDKGNKYWCTAKDDEVSYSQYKDLCKYDCDAKKKCPVRIYWEKNHR